MQLNTPEIIVNYPSGKQETWKPNITLLPTNKLKEKHGIKELYQLSSYSFKESGNITLIITENNTTNKSLNSSKINKMSLRYNGGTFYYSILI